MRFDGEFRHQQNHAQPMHDVNTARLRLLHAETPGEWKVYYAARCPIVDGTETREMTSSNNVAATHSAVLLRMGSSHRKRVAESTTDKMY